MATYGCLLVLFGLTNTIYFVFTPYKLKWVITIIVFGFTFLLPVLNLLLLYKLNYISSLKIEKQEQRTFPLLMTAMCYFGLYYMLLDFNIWPAIKLFILGAGLCILFASIINIWWKISAHMIGIGGMLGVLLSLSYYTQISILPAISMAFVIAGFIGFARLYLKSHTPNQIYVGFAFGGMVQWLLFVFAQNFAFL